MRMILLAGAALTVAALLLLLRARGAMDRRPLETAVAIVLPLPKAQAVAAVRRRLRDKEQPPNPAFKGFAVASAGEPVFPSDDLLRAAAGDNPPLQAYLAIPAAQREDDLYFFEPTGDRYWPSEYFKDGQPVRFRCAFLIHFEAASAGETRVDVLEYVPTVALGKRFGIGAHGPGFLEDIRPVAPTNFDRAQLLRWIAAAFSRK